MSGKIIGSLIRSVILQTGAHLAVIANINKAKELIVNVKVGVKDSHYLTVTVTFKCHQLSAVIPTHPNRQGEWSAVEGEDSN